MGEPSASYPAINGSRASSTVEQVAAVGRMVGEARLGSRYSQLPTITFVVFLKLERCTGMFRQLTISSDVCM